MIFPTHFSQQSFSLGLRDFGFLVFLPLFHDLRIVRVIHNESEHSLGVDRGRNSTQLSPIVSESFEEVFKLFLTVINLGERKKEDGVREFVIIIVTSNKNK
jgi:hypothetical protein